jgi:probable O-glycosylation ligase (exosortase A-associated)
MLAFVCVAFLNPQSFTWGIGRTFPVAMLPAVGTLVGYAMWAEPKKLPFHRESMLLLAFWVMFGISTIFALYPARAVVKLEEFSKVLLMIFLSTSILNTKERLHWLMRVIGLSLGIYALKGGFFVIVSGGEHRVFGPEHTFLAGANPLGMALAMNVPILVYLLRTETIPWFRRLVMMMLGFSYPTVICTYSRGAWLALAAVTAFYIWRSRRRLQIIILGAALGIVFLPLVVVLLPQKLIDKFDELVNYDKDGSSISRFWNWEFCTRAGLAHPFHGAGHDFYSEYAYAKYYPEFLDRWPGKIWSCHSMWFTIFGEHGFPGFIIWIALLGSCFLTLRHLSTYGRGHPNVGWVVPYADSIKVSFVAFFVGGTFFDSAYFDMFYQLIAVLIILKEHVKELICADSAVFMNGRSSRASIGVPEGLTPKRS